MSFKEKIIADKLPKHIAIIMDGNGRWAKTHGKPRVFGHKNGVTSVRETTEAAAEIGIQYLTLYAFSMENWNRPKYEVSALMSLLVETIRNEINTLNKNDIRLNAIGNLDELPDKTAKALAEAIDKTKNNKRMVLTLALNYSGRWELANAAKMMAEDYKSNKLIASALDQNTFESYLNTAEMPDPELLIRTSGELRISNYLLWQIAYAELYFTKKFWPDFRKEDLYEAIVDYQQRERRFGKTSEQII
jgi:undecaprenyl diphosphate synthase